MKKYLIKIRVFPPKKVIISSVTQFKPDYDHPMIESRFRVGDFEDVSRFAISEKKMFHQYIGTRAEVVSIEEV